ncbi:MAG: hypothetical protein AAFO95_01325 [Cyanobacteria bacterium J06600_6]
MLISVFLVYPLNGDKFSRIIGNLKTAEFFVIKRIELRSQQQGKPDSKYLFSFNITDAILFINKI